MTHKSLAFHYASLFWLMGFILAYWPRWLQTRGFDGAEIGLILAAAIWAKLPLNVLLTTLSEQGTGRKPLIKHLALFATLCMPLFLLSHAFSVYIVLWAVCGAAITAMIPLTDSLAVTLQRSESLNYGRLRLWGSLSFIAATIAGGWVLGEIGVEHTLALMMIGAVGLMMTGRSLPDLQPSPARRGRSQSRLLLQQPQFLLFLAAIALVQSSHAVLYGFATIHWRDAGISEAAIGWLWAEGVIAEIAVFYTAAHFTRRLGPWRLLMISSMIASLRWAGLASTTTLTHLILLQWLHAFSFALSHLALVEFITRRVPASATTSAQTLVDALSLGLAFGGTMLLAGILYTAYAGGAWYLMCAMTLIALALAFLGHRRFRAVISF